MTTEPDGVSHHIDGLETRRTAIGRAAFVPLGIAVGLVDADTRAALASVPPAAARDWETFLKRAVPAAKAALEAGSIDHYLYTVAAHAGDLDDAPEPAFRRFGTYDPPVELGMVHRGAPFFVIHWRLAPRAFLPAHCHPKASVCTVGLAGEARLRNFEIEGDAPDFRVDSATEFRIRESKREWMAKGRINTLSPTRDNIHCFEAGAEGARGIDITTSHGDDGKFSFLTLDYDKPIDPDRGVYVATWTGRDENGAVHPDVKR